MAVTVSASPSTCASVMGIGTVAWTNPTRAVSSNNSYATASVDGSTTRFLECTGYGFAIPSGAIINGITVNVERKSSSTSNGGSADAAMLLVKAGTIGATDLSTGTTYPTTDTTEAHGSATELWGDTWTAADINDANFGAAFAATKASATGGAQTVSVDWIQIVVDYTLPPTVSSINLASTNPTAPATAVAWTVVFSASVTGVDATDFTPVQAGGVTGATITSVTGAGTTWTVNANTGSGTGTLGLNLVDNDSIKDTSSIPLGGTGTTGTGDGSFTGQVYTVPAPFCSPPSDIPAGVAVSCVCDTFGRASLNPSTIFGGNWTLSHGVSDSAGTNPYINATTGLLRLTENTNNNAKAATVPSIFPAAGNYISVEFNNYAYQGGNTGADGIAVTLSDYTVPAVPGGFGGSLGYAQRTDSTPNPPGFAGGWVGIALDEYGNFQNPTEGRIGGPGARAQSVGVRGPGSGINGYRYMGGSASNPGGLSISANSTSATPATGYMYQVIVDARNAGTGTINVSVNRDATTKDGSNYSSVFGPFNAYTEANYALSQGWTTQLVPDYWKISFTGSTGGSTNVHEIGSLRICAQTVLPSSGGTASGFSAIDEAYTGSPVPAYSNFQTGDIYTKLVGTPFKFWVAALTSTAISTGYSASSNKYVQVKVVDNTDYGSGQPCGPDSARTCNSTCTGQPAVEAGATQIALFPSGSSTGVASPSPSFTLNSSYRDLVAVMKECTTSACTAFTATAPACSADSFSVRPLSVSVTSSNATNTGTTGTPIIKAGSQNFNLTATTTGVTGNPSKYGLPVVTAPLKINSTLVTAASPATVNGTLTGTFSAATSGTPSSTTGTDSAFTYSEVGGFTLPVNSVYDGVITANDCAAMTATACDMNVRAPTWTGVDSLSTKGDCVADSFSNVKNAAGKYGCNFGNSAAAGPFGRFVPDHFDTVVKYDTVSKLFMPCPTGISPTCPASGDLVYGNGFAYSGQPFTTQVTARNAAGAATVNYDTAKSLSKTVTLSAYDAAGGAVNNPPGGNGTLANNSVPSTAFSAGVALLTNTPTYTFSTTPTVPTDVYVRATESSPGGDGVSSLRGASSVEGGIKVVSGRIKISNAHGSELLPLPISVTAQYWKDSASGWVTSSTDSASSFVVATPAATSAVNFGNFQKNLTTVSVAGSPKTVTLSSGAGGYTLTAGASKDGSVDMSIPALSGASCLVAPTPLGCYLPSNTARATFGVYKGANEFIYLRENY